MASRRDGTVSVTKGSKTVTGVETTFNTSGVYAGDVFSLVDGNLLPTGPLYEVESVQSDTKLTLRQAYQGTTAAAKAYVIMNMAGNQTTPRLAAQAAHLLDEVRQMTSSLSDSPVPAGIPQAGGNGKLAPGWTQQCYPALSGESDSAIIGATTVGDIIIRKVSA